MSRFSILATSLLCTVVMFYCSTYGTTILNNSCTYGLTLRLCVLCVVCCCVLCVMCYVWCLSLRCSPIIWRFSGNPEKENGKKQNWFKVYRLKDCDCGMETMRWIEWNGCNWNGQCVVVQKAGRDQFWTASTSKRSGRHRSVGPLGCSVSVVLYAWNDNAMKCAGKRYTMIRFVA